MQKCLCILIFSHDQQLGSLLLLFPTTSPIYLLDFASIGFILIVLWCVLLYSLTISSNLSVYTFLILSSHICRILFFYYIKVKTYKIYKNLLLHLCINCIPARSVPQILSLKNEHTSRFLNFLIIGLWNTSANCWSDKFSLLNIFI